MRILTFTIAAAFVCSAFAQPPAQSQQQPPAEIGPGSGPFRAMSEVDPGLSDQAIFRPANLDNLGSAPLPIVTWANGGCANTPRSFAPFLTEIARQNQL